jgi:nucleoside-diphosphate-sugar epimerase
MVDVRDVARAHVLAIERGRDGERYLISGRKGESFLGLAKTLAKEFEGSRFSLPSSEAPKWMAWVLSFYDHRLQASLSSYGKSFEFDNSKSQGQLGVEYSDVHFSIVEMANNLIDINYIEDLKN